MRTAIAGLLALVTVGVATFSVVTPGAAQAVDLGEGSAETTLDTSAPEAVQSQEPVDLGTVQTTAYSLRGAMKSGEYTYSGAVAVDPEVIPLGSTIYIEDLGYFVAEDTGSAVKGSHVDIWFPSYREAIQYGVQYRRAWLIG
ncbi:MAG TPA: 3D domain-containing protein [Chloroflexota bacterium]|nr:3D domain-containing protein [Chloroflexota bacterium]